MRNSRLKRRTTWQSWANIVLGLWLIATPWLTHFAIYKWEAIINFWIVGALVTLFAFGAICTKHLWEQGINFALGIWIAMSPWIFHFKAVHTPFWNAIVVGALVAICAGASAPGGEKLKEALGKEFVPAEPTKSPVSPSAGEAAPAR